MSWDIWERLCGYPVQCTLVIERKRISSKEWRSMSTHSNQCISGRSFWRPALLSRPLFEWRLWELCAASHRSELSSLFEIQSTRISRSKLDLQKKFRKWSFESFRMDLNWKCKKRLRWVFPSLGDRFRIDKVWDFRIVRLLDSDQCIWLETARRHSIQQRENKAIREIMTT